MSFFAKPAYISYRHDPAGHLKRGSSRIRGEQISKYLGAKYNPDDGFENDVRIYVKPTPDMYPDIEAGGQIYVDILDSSEAEVEWLKNHPSIDVIAPSETAYDYLVDVLGRKNIVLIPQHHCNYERFQRKQNGHFTAGYISTPRELKKFLADIEQACRQAGVELKVLSYFNDRQEIQDFYKNVDLQIIWRNQKFGPKELKNALKMANAGSFGIPSIAQPEIGYNEYKDYYVPINSFEEMAQALNDFKENTGLYQRYSKKNLQKAEEYHIEHIAKKYRELLPA